MIWKREVTLEALNAMCEGNMVGLLDIRFEHIGDDTLEATMPVDHRTKQPFGLLHGGASVVLAESIGSVAGYLCTQGEQKVVGLEVNANHVCEAVNEPVSMIVDAVRNTLERTPPELSADIMDRGIVMTGGSSMLRNLDRLISQETGMPVFVSDEALNCVALGTGIAVENIDIYRKGFMTSK